MVVIESLFVLIFGVDVLVMLFSSLFPSLVFSSFKPGEVPHLKPSPSSSLPTNFPARVASGIPAGGRTASRLSLQSISGTNHHSPHFQSSHTETSTELKHV
ncbi:hypothetical protein BJ508DRAFT_419109 [Ascobolus immersus RN42]|uniref:Uncharacterized protein n=1 Tax=Ascobolus immersus RN42 TaxID=1160509 RepID=A0A3N4HMI8_ASCIM|nr:hypothetical protein BJ508DRAFT_419109 [Ascobolus immersus RN42]